MESAQPAASGTIVVLGEGVAVDSFALAGATVLRAEQPDDVRRAWRSLAPDTGVVVLTAAAAAALGAAVDERADGVLTVVMPS